MWNLLNIDQFERSEEKYEIRRKNKNEKYKKNQKTINNILQ